MLFIIYLGYATHFGIYQKPLLDALIEYKNNPAIDNTLFLREATKIVVQVVEETAKVNSITTTIINSMIIIIYDTLIVVFAGESNALAQVLGEQRTLHSRTCSRNL